MIFFFKFMFSQLNLDGNSGGMQSAQQQKEIFPLVEDENKRHLIITIEDLNNNNKNGIPYSP